jgi:hypothetical protein
MPGWVAASSWNWRSEWGSAITAAMAWRWSGWTWARLAPPATAARVSLAREATAAPNPSAGDLSGALEVAMRNALALDERPRVTMRLEPDAPTESVDEPPPDLIAALMAGLTDARDDYRLPWSRDPSSAELARTVQFVVAPVVSDLLAVAEATDLTGIDVA